MSRRLRGGPFEVGVEAGDLLFPPGGIGIRKTVGKPTLWTSTR